MPHSGVSAYGNAPQRKGDYRCRKREIDEKDPAPGSVLNEPAAQHRTNRGGDRRETRPCADRLAAALLVEGRADDCKAAGHEQRSSHTLNAPRAYQLLNVRSNSTTHGSHCEHGNPNYEHHAAPKQIAERTTDQNQGC